MSVVTALSSDSELRMVRSGLTRHPLSEAWGDMPEDQLIELAEDIKQHGQKETVVVINGSEVIDGWHRAKACQFAGIEIRVYDLPADKDPRAYVISKNAHRRNQTASQRAAAIVMCNQWRPIGVTGSSAPGADLRPSSKEMADQVNVGTRTIEQAKTAVNAGLGPAVVSGEMSAKKAAQKARSGESSESERPKPPSQLENAKAEISELKAELADRDAKIEEITDHLDSYLDAAGGEDEQQIKFAQLREQIRILKSQLNEQMMLTTQFKRESKVLRRQLGEQA